MPRGRGSIWRRGAPTCARGCPGYRYSPDRKGEHPQHHFTGALHADGYAGFRDLYKADRNGAVRVAQVACWAHVRRKFHDVHVATGAPIARQVLERIGKLFEVERAINASVR